MREARFGTCHCGRMRNRLLLVTSFSRSYLWRKSQPTQLSLAAHFNAAAFVLVASQAVAGENVESLLQAQLPTNETGQRIGNLGMARYGGALAVGLVDVDVMRCAMAKQNAALALKTSYQLPTLQGRSLSPGKPAGCPPGRYLPSGGEHP